MSEDAKKELKKFMSEIFDIADEFSENYEVSLEQSLEIAKTAILSKIWFRAYGIEASLDAMIPGI